MPKRFTATELWDEDWFLEMPVHNQMFWFFLKDDCDHAGVWKPKTRKFEIITGFTVNLQDFLKDVNKDKERIQVLANGRWFIPGFFVFQYGTNFNMKNRVHASVEKVMLDNDLNLRSIRGLVEV